MSIESKYREAAAKARGLAEKYGDDMTEEQYAEVKAAVEEVERLEGEKHRVEEKAAVLSKISGFGGEAPKDSSVGREAATLGEHFVKHAGERLQGHRHGHIDVAAPEFKAAKDPHKNPAEGDSLLPLITTLNRSIVNQRRERLVVADLMGAVSVSTPIVSYPIEKAGDARIAEGKPATVAEAAKKPYVRYVYPELVSESVKKIAALTKVSEEMLQDSAFLVDWINTQLLYDLSVAEEVQLLNGDGNGTNIKGLLSREGLQTATVKAASQFDDLFKTFRMVAAETPFEADGLMVNPADYETIRLAKDKNGQYLAGGPFQGQYGNGGFTMYPGPWGMKTVVTNAVPKGTGIVGAFRQGATVLRRMGVRVDSSNTNVDDFENNLVTLRAEERLGLMVPIPKAFVKVTFSGAAGGGGDK